MQNILKIFVVFWAALSLIGCDAPSLHPFFTDEDIVFNEALLGVWVSDSGEKCIITRSGDKHYELLYFEDAPARFEARLFELGGATLLDIYPKPMRKDIDFYPANLVPAHTLARVTIGEDSISIAMMDGDWLKQLGDRNQLALAHERLDDGMIALTAPTRELRAFVLKHADSKEAFGEAEVFHRLRSDK
jgi:hypothetical protein